MNNPLPFTPAEAEGLTADEIVAAALDAFHPDIALACSFQQEEAVLLDMAFAARADARVFALDTGVLFPETYATWRAVEGRGYHLEHGPFSSEATVTAGEAPTLIQEILRAALWGGATHVSFQVDVLDGDQA